MPADDPRAVAFYEAIRAGDLDAVERLLVEHRELATARFVDSGRGHERTALHVVTDWPGHVPNGRAVVARLVAAGADVDAAFGGTHAERPLHWAAGSDDVKVLDALVEAGADIEAPGSLIDVSATSQREGPDMKRSTIEFMIGWLDALRRDDVGALSAMLAPDVGWQGLRDEWTCHGAESVIDTFAGEREAKREIGAIELIGADHHVILHASGGDIVAIEDIPLPDGIYNVFTLHAGTITRIEDYADRRDALAAAGLSDATAAA